VRAASQTGGAYLTVGDDDILTAIADLGRVGIFAEPAGATAYAGLKEALKLGMIGSNDPVVVLNTGSGLKDVKAAMQAVSPAEIIEPSLTALEQVLQRIG
jgi:threonine synthase